MARGGGHHERRITVLSRASGRSSVAAAAYRAGESLTDERTGRAHDYRRRSDVLSSEVIGWPGGDLDTLWNAAEAAERRGDACGAREACISLPAELPLDAQVRLVRGYALWLRDRYGVAVHAAVHEPRWHDARLRARMRADRSPDGRWVHEAAMADAACTNRNFHAHVLWTTRRVDPGTGALGAKTRVLDDRRTGSGEIKRLREEWQRRANAALAKADIAARVDLRSYADQAAAGDAPEGLAAQQHLGPRRAARSRAMTDAAGMDHSRPGARRAARRAETNETWACWLQLRALERERARREDSARIAAEREAERRERAAAERARLQAASTAAERAMAAAASVNLAAPRSDGALWAAIAAARAAGEGQAGDRAWRPGRGDGAGPAMGARAPGNGHDAEPWDEFDAPLDLEADDRPPRLPAAPGFAIRVRQRARERQRTRGG